jgi:deoxyhypusine synthase
MSESLFRNHRDITPVELTPGQSVATFIETVGETCFEARVLRRAARLWQQMIDDGAQIWFGIAGAGIAGGLGGLVKQQIENGFLDVICTTGAQAYHDLHFAYGLPVKAISPHVDDDACREHGDTRIYDIGVRDRDTLEAQDAVIRRFIETQADVLKAEPLSSPVFMKRLGEWVAADAPHPERSFVVAAAAADVPVFWDSFTNHSIGMNIADMAIRGYPLPFAIDRDVFLSAALVHEEPDVGYVELGGGGPKNFIQQTGPTLSQILGIKEHRGASRGIQITTANVREGSLSSCTFGEAVTWGKYEHADEEKLVQVWGEYSVLYPLLSAYVLERCRPRPLRRAYSAMAPRLARLRLHRR